MLASAAIPEEVLKEVQEELLEWNDAKSSVMEVSHRSDFFQEVASESKKDFIELLNIPENYDVLFLQGWGNTTICDDTFEFC